MQCTASLGSAASARGNTAADFTAAQAFCFIYLFSSYFLLFLFLSQSALYYVLYLTFSTGLSFHSAGHMHSPRICTPGALGRCMDQCLRIYAQNMPQAVSLDSRVPSGKCLTHISQITQSPRPRFCLQKKQVTALATVLAAAR